MAYTTRTASWIISKAYKAAKAKSTAPTSGTKYDLLLDIIDNEQRNWQDEPDTQWDSLYLKANCADTVTTEDTYELPDTIREISKRADDYVLVGTTKYKIVRPSQLSRYQSDNVVAQVGRNLVFPSDFTAGTASIGATITVPGYGYVNDITAGTDLVEVDNPQWLIYACAAEFIRNDIVKGGQYQNLLDKAELVMEKMKQNNSGQVEELVREFAVEGETWA